MSIPSSCRAGTELRGMLRTPWGALNSWTQIYLPHHHMNACGRKQVSKTSSFHYQCSHVIAPWPEGHHCPTAIQNLSQGRAEVLLCYSFSLCSLTRNLSVTTTAGAKFLQLDFPPLTDPNAEPALHTSYLISLGSLTRFLHIKPGFNQTSTGPGHWLCKLHFCEEAVHKLITWYF